MNEDELLEIKAFIKAVKGEYVSTDNFGYCKGCGQWRDLREGYCFDCVFPECPLEVCSYKKIVYNGLKKRVIRDSKYIGITGKQYCNRPEGLCEEALEYLRNSNNSRKEGEP